MASAISYGSSSAMADEELEDQASKEPIPTIVLPDGNFLVKTGKFSWLVNSELLIESPFFKIAIEGNFKEAIERSITIKEADAMTIGCLIQWFYFGKFSEYFEFDTQQFFPCHLSPSPFDDMSFDVRGKWYNEMQTPAMRACATDGKLLLAMYEIADRFMLPRLQWYVIWVMFLDNEWLTWEKWVYRNEPGKHTHLNYEWDEEDLELIDYALRQFSDFVEPLAVVIASDLEQAQHEERWYDLLRKNNDLAVATSMELVKCLKRSNIQKGRGRKTKG